MGALRDAVLAYHHRAVRLPRAGRVAGALARQIGAAASLLDVGCDDGRVAREVGKRVGATRIVGVDLGVRSDVAIDAVPYDGETLPFEDGAFEAVTVSDVLHHCADPRRLLGEALRVAARVVAVKDHFRFGPVSDKLLYLMDTIGNAQPGVHVRGRYFYPAEWLALVRASGGRVTGLDWPLQIHDYPWRLVTQDRLQFAAGVERAGADA
jgi:SAM-dependent methyltransferase